MTTSRSGPHRVGCWRAAFPFNREEGGPGEPLYTGLGEEAKGRGIAPADLDRHRRSQEIITCWEGTARWRPGATGSSSILPAAAG
jgi:hypothetical protein